MTQPVPATPTLPPLPVVPQGTGNAALASYEAAFAASVLAAYTVWLTDVAALVLFPYTAFGLMPDPSAIWSTQPTWDRQVERLLSGLEKLARLGWEDAADQLSVNLPFDRDDPLLQDVLARTRNLLVRTPDEVYRQILNELGKGREQGESITDLAARVRRLLDVHGVENWPARARTVAVTEVNRAFNFGALAAAQRVQHGIQQPLVKTWASKDDQRVRPAHWEADGQTVAVFQPFQVGGEPLMMPGDPAGAPWNVINCRCKARFRRAPGGR
jgi:uncharacterized protein with gpF-like domain